MSTRDNIINFVLFQLGWFACVLSSAAHQPWLGALVAVAVLAWHLARANAPRLELYLLLVAMFIGAVWDSVLVWGALLDYSSGVLLPNTAPYWIVIMWALFASTLNLSLGWLKKRYFVAVVLGAVAGPLAYYAGANFGALSFVNQTNALIALAIGWAIFTPLLVAIAERMNGFAPTLTRA